MNKSFNILTISFLATHQVDAAFQKEWELFGVPGGIDFFLFFNVIAVGILIYGLTQVVSSRNAKTWNLIVSGTGFLTCAIHLLFIIRGHEQFTQAGSLIILGALAVTSAGQLFTRP